VYICARAAAYFTKIYTAAVFYFNKTKYIVQIMKCELQMKQIKMKEAFGRFEFGFTEMCFPSPAWDISIN